MSNREINSNQWQVINLNALRPLKLAENEAHVWLTSLNSANFAASKQLLSADEQARAERFVLPRHRKNYAAARSFLRTVLAGYLETKPELIQFSYNDFGKPSLSGGAKDSRLRFNLSHSGDYALLAATKIGEIGVDIELIQPSFVDKESASQFLTPKEIRHLFEQPKSEQVKLYFDYWTQKEAYLKMRGDGLQLQPDKFDLNSLLEGCEKPNCFFQKLPAINGYSSALVILSSDWKNNFHLICRELAETEFV